MRAHTFYISPSGNDRWSGLLAEPNPDQSDGPFATLGCARDTIRKLKLSGRLAGPVTVYLRDGGYTLSAPIVFTSDDSAPVTYTAFPGEKPFLDGGKRISSWSTERINGREAWVKDCDDMRYFRELFVDGERRHRARLPKVEIVHAQNGRPAESFYRMENVPGASFKAELFAGSNRFIAKAGEMQSWKHLQDVEVVALHYWIEERMPVAAFDPQTRQVKCTRRSTFALKDDFVNRWAKYYLDNVMEGLTDPGEWYLERREQGGLRLYYLPLPGENMDSAEVVAPQIEQFLLFRGEPEHQRFVEFIRFENIAFAHSDWSQPKGVGDPSAQNMSSGADVLEFASAPQGAANVSGVIQMEGARYCAIENCAIQHTGFYGVELKDGCRGIRIVGNDLFDLGAGGIHLNGADAFGPQERQTGDNVISDNHIHQCGRVFHSGIGILSRHSFGNLIVHNHIHDLFYSGISCGWVWGYQENVSRHNTIEKNHIHDLGHGWLSDMGGVYMLGTQPDSVVRGNLIHDIEKANYGGWALYTDEGSTGIVLENNVCYHTNAQLFHQHYGHENIVRNNILAFGGEAAVALSRYDGVQAFTFERNIIITGDVPLFLGGYGNLHTENAIQSDLNLFWSQSGAPLSILNAVGGPLMSLNDWQAAGQDVHSIVADPRLKSTRLDAFDWTLAEDSPALSLGFKPIDLSDVGPRPVDQR